MANPTIVSPGEQRLKQAKLSDLMLAKQASATGEKVNACPFGCQVADLDDNGYCRHLIGFSNAPFDANGLPYWKDGLMMEPMIPHERWVKDEEGNRVKSVNGKVVAGKTPLPVLKTDKLIRITISSRVYRDIGEEDKPKQPESWDYSVPDNTLPTVAKKAS